MILNVIVIAAIAIPTFFWATSGKGRGVYSSFLNLVCVLIAGAIAFGLWESVAMGLLGAAKSGGLLDSIAWGAGLLLPFVVSLGVLRLTFDILLGANIHFDDTTNMVGGALFGLIAAFITTGVIATSFQFFGTGRTFAGYSAITDERGNLLYNKPLWVPADKFTIAFYEHLSLGALRTETPLALMMPDANQQGAMSRIVYATNGLARFGLKPDDFEILGRYTVQGSGDALLADINQPELPQSVVFPDQSKPAAGSTIEGIAVRLRSGAVERSGQVIFGAGQARLIVRKGATDEAMGLHPVAILAPPENGGGYYRFRISGNSDDIFVPTVGGAAENVFIFEFVVPAGYSPTAITLKNARKDLKSVKPFERPLAGWEERDQLFADGTLLDALGIKASGAVGTVDASGSVTVSIESGRGDGVRSASTLPGNYVIIKGEQGGLRIEPDGEAITGGEHTFRTDDLANRGAERSLRRDRFAESRTTGIVQLDMTTETGLSIFGKGIAEATDLDAAPVLVSSTGETFNPVGYVNVTEGLVTIRFRPEAPIGRIRDLPIQLSATKRGQNLVLVYRPTKGTEIVGFALLDQAGNGIQVAEFSPPLEISR